MTKLIGAFRNFANAPKKKWLIMSPKFFFVICWKIKKMEITSQRSMVSSSRGSSWTTCPWWQKHYPASKRREEHAQGYKVISHKTNLQMLQCYGVSYLHSRHVGANSIDLFEIWGVKFIQRWPGFRDAQEVPDYGNFTLINLHFSSITF